ncbi:unnamed protein product [Periconia digitata]|uniref:Uncharacterized protein n=1 Tax=Periconia digitata TaxID=1303443 RepID=A0A9W4XRR5_9PLEO|nr:unnamed protein product [Periconia digitata]
MIRPPSYPRLSSATCETVSPAKYRIHAPLPAVNPFNVNRIIIMPCGLSSWWLGMVRACVSCHCAFGKRVSADRPIALSLQVATPPPALALSCPVLLCPAQPSLRLPTLPQLTSSPAHHHLSSASTSHPSPVALERCPEALRDNTHPVLSLCLSTLSARLSTRPSPPSHSSSTPTPPHGLRVTTKCPLSLRPAPIHRCDNHLPSQLQCCPRLVPLFLALSRLQLHGTLVLLPLLRPSYAALIDRVTSCAASRSRSQLPNTCQRPSVLISTALHKRHLSISNYTAVHSFLHQLPLHLSFLDCSRRRVHWCAKSEALLQLTRPQRPHLRRPTTICNMESERPHLSITLPRNFMFHYRDGQLPQTPEPESQPDELVPPPPPRQMLKVRRRRGTFAPTSQANDLDMVNDNPIPTIEGPEYLPNTSSDLPNLHSSVDKELLSPPLTFGRMLSPPKTPIAQMGSLASFDGPQHWSDVDNCNQSESSSRPTSSGGFSDSSISSRESFESFPSLGGSCTSPEEEMTDPFEFSPVQKHPPQLDSPIAPRQARPPKTLKLRATFTEEMDNHLWMTYLKYLQDPTVTPFKALPSTVPPNGVCHRVARLARRTWKGGKSAPMFSKLRSVSRYQTRGGTPDTIKPTKSGSSTPVPKKPYARHPDEKSTRKRLRYLARQKPTLSAHYQRLLRRSPSPFQSSPEEESSSTRPPVLSSPFTQVPASFSTRDMNVSLTTSTAPSMQAGNPLAQLANGITPRPIEDRANLRAYAHQKSQSLHIGLGIGLGLQNSFQTMSQMTDISMNQHSSRTWHAPSARPSRLGSPLQLHSPRPISRPFKRRALHNFEEQARSRGNSFIDQVFGAPAQSSHRRVRSRGFSLGDMVEGARRLPLSTTGPTELNPFATLNDKTTAQALPSPANSMSHDSPDLQEQATVRLGSPFGARPNNTFPRASTSYGFEPPASFEERFASLPHH